MILNADGWTLVGTQEQIEAFLQRLSAHHQIMNLSKVNIILLKSPINTATVAMVLEPLARRKGS